MSSNSFSFFATSIDKLCGNDLFSLAYNCVSKDRQVKTDKYKFNSDKYLSLGAEILLKYSLYKLGYQNNRLEFEYKEHNKPYIKNSDVCFNLSHSGNYVICAVANKEIGCDIEKIKPIDLNIAKRFFTASEYENILSKSSDKDKLDLFYKYWVLKESFIKNTGLGFSCGFDSFEIDFSDKDIFVNQPLNSNKYNFKYFDNISGYACGVCSTDNLDNLNLTQVDILDCLHEVNI